MSGENPKPTYCRVIKSERTRGTRGNGTAWKEDWLTLECGRCIDRPVRHKKGGSRGWGAMWHTRPISEELPAPKKIKCFCQKKCKKHT